MKIKDLKKLEKLLCEFQGVILYEPDKSLISACRVVVKEFVNKYIWRNS